MKSIKFVFLKAMIIVVFTFSAGQSYSQNPSESYSKTEGANKIHFMGIEDGYLLFDLRFLEVPAKGCILKIMDSDGNTMFEETMPANSYSRRYKVPKDETSRISFKALGKGFTFNQSFIMKTESKLVVIAE